MHELTAQSRSAPAPSVALGLEEAIRSWETLSEWLPIGICVCDRHGIIVLYNDRAAALWGGRPPLGDPKFRYCGAYGIYTEQGAAPGEAPMSEVLRTGRPVRDREYILERPDGTRLAILANLEPIFDALGEIVGGVNCFQDITERKRVEGERLDSERRFRDLLDALPAAIYTTDAEGRITFYNKAAAALSGRRPRLGVDRWCVTWHLYAPDGTPLPHEECPMAVALKEKRPVRGAEIIAERPDGARIAVIPYPTPLRDADGALVGAVNMLVDISERKQGEARQRALVDELNHRVKNTLATVQSLAAQTLSSAGISAEVRESFEARLLALSRTHDQLTLKHWESAELGRIVDVVVAPYVDGERVRVAGDPVQIAPRAALTLGMVLHELATNAAKYGSLSTAAGRLDVSWTIRGPAAARRVEIDWRESDGPPVREPQRQGFGTRLLHRGVAHELKGAAEIVFARRGIRCRMEIPLSSCNR